MNISEYAQERKSEIHSTRLREKHKIKGSWGEDIYPHGSALLLCFVTELPR
jgi:hypothetical protein